MSEINHGTPEPQEQPLPGTPGQEQATSQNGQQTTPPQPSVEELQRQNQEFQARLAQQENQYKELQGEFTRRSQALAQLTGAQQQQAPPPDPVQELTQRYKQKGYKDEDLGMIREFVSAAMQPLQQRNQYLEQQVAATQQASNVDYLLANVANQNQPLFVNPATAQAVRQEALNFVSQGGTLNPDLLRRMAIIHAYENPLNGQQPATPQHQPNPQQRPPVPQTFANGMWNPGISYQPAPQPKPQGLTPEQQEAANFISQFTKPKP